MKRITNQAELLAQLRVTDSSATIADTYRFCAWIEAKNVGELNRREMINLMQEGFKGYKTEQDVNEMLGTLGYDDEYLDEDSTDEAAMSASVCYPSYKRVDELAAEYFGK